MTEQEFLKLIATARDKFLTHGEKLPEKEFFSEKDYQEIETFLATDEGKESLKIMDLKGRTPLYNATRINDPKLAEILLKAGANPDEVHTNYYTPRDIARKRSDKIFNLIEARKAQDDSAIGTEKKSSNSLTSQDDGEIGKATSSSSSQDAPAAAKKKKAKKKSESSSSKESPPEKKELTADDLNKMAQKYHCRFSNNTPLGVDGILLRNDRTTDGNSLLHHACIANDIEDVKILLAENANTNKQNNDGKTPIDLATNKEIKMALQEYVVTGNQQRTRQIDAIMNKGYAAKLMREYVGVPLSADKLKEVRELFGEIKNDPNRSADPNLLLYYFCARPLVLDNIPPDQLALREKKMRQFYQKNSLHPSLTPNLLERKNLTAKDFQEHEERLSVVLVKDLLASGANPSLIADLSNSNFTFFNKACSSGNFSVAKILLENLKKNHSEADLKKNCLIANSETGLSPLHYCATHNNPLSMALAAEILRIENSALKLCSKSMHTPVAFAIAGDNIEVARLMVQKGAILEMVADKIINTANETMIAMLKEEEQKSFEAGRIKTPRFLLAEIVERYGAKTENKDLGIDGYYVDEDEYTSLLCNACELNDCETARLLIKMGANVDLASGIFGETPLHIACMEGNKELFDILLENNADIFACDAAHNTLLHMLAMGQESPERIAMAQILLEHHVNPNQLNLSAETALDVTKSETIANLLTEKISSMSEEKGSLSEEDLQELVKKYDGEFIVKNPGINSPIRPRSGNPIGNCLLHLACWRGDLNDVQKLLKSGADATKTNQYGQTMLHALAHENNLSPDRLAIARLLIEHHVDLNKENSAQRRAAQVAESADFKELADLINNINKTALTNAFVNNDLNTAAALMKEGVSHLLVDKEVRSAVSEEMSAVIRNALRENLEKKSAAPSPKVVSTSFSQAVVSSKQAVGKG